jgi:hypothetical protein
VGKPKARDEEGTQPAFDTTVPEGQDTQDVNPSKLYEFAGQGVQVT